MFFLPWRHCNRPAVKRILAWKWPPLCMYCYGTLYRAWLASKIKLEDCPTNSALWPVHYTLVTPLQTHQLICNLRPPYLLYLHAFCWWALHLGFISACQPDEVHCETAASYVNENHSSLCASGIDPTGTSPSSFKVNFLNSALSAALSEILVFSALRTSYTTCTYSNSWETLEGIELLWSCTIVTSPS